VHASRDSLTFQGDIMHNKYFVIDEKYVWMGSTNVSDSGTGGYNANAVGVLKSPVIAKWYTNEFENFWAGRAHDEKQSQGRLQVGLTDKISVDGYFSPQDRPITNAVRPLLQQARERIDVAIFFLTHKGIAKDLIEAHQRGVKVRVIMDATAAKNGYAKHELVRTAGVPLKIENWGGKMHMKSVAIDGSIVVLGSMNWTSAGERGNDENTLVIRSRSHAEQFHTYYDRIWAAIPDKWLEGRPDPESRESSSACSDGSDNDFDHLRDDEDPGCGANPPPMPSLPPFVIVPKINGQRLIKGNISSSGRRIYHVPGGEYYDKVAIRTEDGEAYFCSEEDARDAGFKRSSK
jgi:phosphatidylserine/phosphatidylglycerophosphate/cardiolipin synthase-like enzyme